MKEGDQVTLWIEETPQTQVAIGSITTDEEHREQLAPEIQLTLPHAALTDFWHAASRTDSAPRNVTLKIEDAMMELAITDVVLLEGTPIHPVVAELRFMWRPLRLFLPDGTCRWIGSRRHPASEARQTRCVTGADLDLEARRGALCRDAVAAERRTIPRARFGPRSH
jgi:hypothetical protein